MKLLLPIIVVLVLAAGYFVFSRNNPLKLQSAVSQSQSPKPANQLTSTQLKNYENNFLKFTLSYPENWQILESGTDVIFATTKEGLGKDETRREELRVFIGRTPLLQGQNLEKYISDIDGRSTPNILDQKSILVDGQRAIRRLNGLDKYKAIVIYVQSGTKIYTISATPADSKLMPVFDQILQTFKFN
ncbi:MAG: PsbP-related protein [Candidatus Curtissbacteria bacterium]